MKYSIFEFVPIASFPFTGYQWEEPGSILYSLSHQLFIHIDKIPLVHLSSPSFLSLSWHNRCSIPWILWPFDGFIPVCQLLFAQGYSELDTTLQLGVTSAEGQLFLSWPAADAPTKAWLCCESPLLAHGHLGICQDTLVLFYQAAFQPAVPQHGAQGYSSLWAILTFSFS